MEVNVIKLVTGEEIFGVVEEWDEKKQVATIDNPRVPMQNQQGISMLPWPMVSKQTKVFLKMEHIMMVVYPLDQFADMYKEAVTGIVKAPANALDKTGKIII